MISLSHLVQSLAWVVLGVAVGVFAMGWLVVARDDERVADLKGENAKLRDELTSVLAARREQCLRAYTNGLAMGLATKHASHATVIMDAATFHEIRTRAPEILKSRVSSLTLDPPKT